MSQLPRFEQLLDQQPEPEEAPLPPPATAARDGFFARQVAMTMTFSYDMEDALSGDEAQHGWSWSLGKWCLISVPKIELVHFQ